MEVESAQSVKQDDFLGCIAAAAMRMSPGFAQWEV